MGDESENAYFRRLVDEDALEEYLESHLGAADSFEVEHHKAGHSNETLFVTWGDRDLVVRRPPPGETADTAHDVLREYRVLDALQDTAVPVPPTVLACDDHSVVGSDFYLMERVEGDVLREEEPERFATPDRRRRIGEEVVDTLAEIHALDYEAVGLADFGRPEGYTTRQVDRWRKQLAWASEITTREREVPAMETVGEWLADNCPTDHPHTLVHGDYKLDNVLFGPEPEPELRAVFDWELSTLGDPRADLGWLLAFWRDSTAPPLGAPELVSTVMAADGYPSRRELLDRYERRAGIAFERQRFYRALAVYKLAVLGEMFFRRHLEGNSDDSLYPTMRERVPSMGERALRIVEGDEPL